MNLDEFFKLGLISQIYNSLNCRPRLNQEAQFNIERWNQKKNINFKKIDKAKKIAIKIQEGWNHKKKKSYL
jgi:uncharacterized membrane protein YjjP (DUF1212 family)